MPRSATEGPGSGASPEPTTPPPTWNRVLVWVERIVMVVLLVFVAVRLGPQIGALVGWAPGATPAPAYTAVTLEGDTIRSEDLAGKVVVVNFWATWCIPCRLEMPSLQRLHERHTGEDLVVLGLSVDAGRDDPIRAFLTERGITYPVGRATAEQRRAFGGIPGIPTTFIVARDGTVRHKVVGYFAPPAMDVAVSRLLESRSP